MMTQFLVLALVALKLLALPLWPGAGSGASAWAHATGRRGLQPVLTTSELVGAKPPGLGLLKEHQLLDEADVVVRVYELHGQQAQLKAQMPAPLCQAGGR